MKGRAFGRDSAPAAQSGPAHDPPAAASAVGGLALQSVSDQTPPAIPALFRHDVALFRFLESELEKAMPSAEGRDSPEPILILLSLFYFSIVAFSDSSLQQALLGGSVYEDVEVRERVKRFRRAEDGASVLLVDIQADKVSRVAESIRESGDGWHVLQLEEAGSDSRRNTPYSTHQAAATTAEHPHHQARAQVTDTQVRVRH